MAKAQGFGVVSADSMNLYQGMDIGTAKPSASERAEVEYAGVDIVNPTEKFSVAAYLRAVAPALKAPPKKIVAGGTGLYVKCLTEGFDDLPPENPALRAELEALDFQTLESRAQAQAADLYSKLTEDDRQNPRRLIRILEKSSGTAPSFPSPSWNSAPKPTLVGLHIDRKELHRRIEQRVEAMYADGLLQEAAKLIELNLSPTALQAIGYAEAFAVLKTQLPAQEAKERTVIRTRQLAKRQMTWFRNQLHIEWIDATAVTSLETLAAAVSNAWKKQGPTPLQI
jgi:tRNA dimethylallyltransferase